jgi:transcription elongation GreA/GreB family factor
MPGTPSAEGTQFSRLQNLYGTKMSRAFVKEQDVESFEELPDRHISELPNDVYTGRNGANRCGACCHADGAQAANDRAAMAAASRDLRYWNTRRGTARIVLNSTDITQVRFGSSVTILRDDGRRQTFRIVGEDEANPSRGTISHVSPLARALFGKSIGDRVKAGDGEAEIRNIQVLG